MLHQIVINTPLWVWALLAFLIYRGLLASVDRVVAFKKLFIIPLVMLALSAHGMVSAFGSHTAAVPLWLTCMAMAAVLSWHWFNIDNIAVHPERQAIAERGSWMPLLLMLGIFITKYAVGVTLATAPAIGRELVFVAGVSALYGVFNGIFIGRLLRIVAIYREGLGRAHKLL